MPDRKLRLIHERELFFAPSCVEVTLWNGFPSFSPSSSSFRFPLLIRDLSRSPDNRIPREEEEEEEARFGWCWRDLPLAGGGTTTKSVKEGNMEQISSLFSLFSLSLSIGDSKEDKEGVSLLYPSVLLYPINMRVIASLARQCSDAFMGPSFLTHPHTQRQVR